MLIFNYDLSAIKLKSMSIEMKKKQIFLQAFNEKLIILISYKHLSMHISI